MGCSRSGNECMCVCACVCVSLCMFILRADYVEVETSKQVFMCSCPFEFIHVPIDW